MRCYYTSYRNHICNFPMLSQNFSITTRVSLAYAIMKKKTSCAVNCLAKTHSSSSMQLLQDIMSYIYSYTCTAIHVHSYLCE